VSSGTLNLAQPISVTVLDLPMACVCVVQDLYPSGHQDSSEEWKGLSLCLSVCYL